MLSFLIFINICNQLIIALLQHFISIRKILFVFVNQITKHLTTASVVSRLPSMCNFANSLLRGTWPFLKGEDTILSDLLSFLSSSRFSLASSWAIRLNASAKVARRQTISSLCAKDCLSRSATLPKRDPVSHSSISSGDVKGNSV